MRSNLTYSLSIGLLLVFFLVFPALVIADEDAGVESIFSLGMGARSLGMGRAFVAVCDDASAVFWNPAGLRLVPQRELTVFYVTLFEDARYDCVGFVYPTLHYGSFGLGGMRMRIDRIHHTTYASGPETIGYFDNVQSLYFLSFGTYLPYSLVGGISFKILSHQMGLAGYSGSGYGLDMGLLYYPKFLDRLTFGLNLQDVGGTSLKLRDDADVTPINVKAGISYQLPFVMEGERAILAVDLDKTKGKSFSLHVGTEFSLWEHYLIRAGMDWGGLVVGGGLRYRGFQFDYAWDSHEDLGWSHRISLATRFGSTVDERKLAEESRRREEERQRTEAHRRQQVAFYLERAESFYEKGDLAEALAEYQKVLAWENENQLARERIDVISAEMNQRLIEDIAKERDTAIIEEHIALGVEYIGRGNYRLAIDEFEKILELDPGNKTAIEYLDKTRQLIDQEIERHRQQARTHQTNGQFSNAIQEWNEVLLLHPQDQEAKESILAAQRRFEVAEMVRRGVERFDAEDYTGAIVEFDAVLGVEPSNRTAREYIQRAMAKMATPTLLDELRNDKPIWELYMRGLDEYQKGNYQGAISLWQQVLDKYPNNENTIRNIEKAKARLQKVNSRGER